MSVPYKFYKSNEFGNVDMLPGTNTPYGYTEVSQQDFINYMNANPTKAAAYRNSTNPGTADNFNAVMNNQTVDTGISWGVDPVSGQAGWGNWDQQKATDQAHQAAIAAGTEKNIGTATAPMYVPTGSAADKLATGLQNGTVSPTNPIQQQAAAMTGNNTTAPGIVPVAPTPQPTPQPAQQQAGQGLQFNDVQQAQTQNPPQYGQQGQIINSTNSGTQGTQNTSGGLQMNDLQQSQTENPPQYDQQGMLIPGTGGLKDQVDHSQNKQNSVLTDNGIDPNSLNPNQSPLLTFADTYKQVMASLGLPDIKKQFEDTTKKYADLQNELNDKIQAINDDPWLTEGVRLKKIESLQNKYEGKLKILTDQIGQYDSIYKQGQQQAQFVAEQAVSIAHNQQVLDQQWQIAQMNLAEKQLEYESTLALNIQKAQSTPDLQEYEYALAQGYTGSFTQYQREMANLKAKAAGAGLDSIFNASQINATVNQIAGSFDNEPIVKQYNTIAEQVNFVKNAGTTPTDDIGRVYAFAKVMDPNSVVREGEYKTVQDYSTSLLQNFGLKAQRVFTNTGFLTDEARRFMETTLDNRLRASQQNYDNVYNQYQQRINNALQGKGNTLPQYSNAFNGTTDTSNLPPLSQFNFQLGQ